MVFLRPKVQVIGPILFAQCAPNLSSFAMSVLKKPQLSKTDITPSKRRTGTGTSNSSMRSSNALLISGAPSTARTVWTSCSLPRSSYTVQTHFLDMSFHLQSFSLVLIFFWNILQYRTSIRLCQSDHLLSNPTFHPYTCPLSGDSQTLNIHPPLHWFPVLLSPNGKHSHCAHPPII